jgi:hypothetical protein
MQHRKLYAAAAAASAVVVSTMAFTSPGSASTDDGHSHRAFSARLNSLNDSGAHGSAHVHLDRTGKLDVNVRASGLSPRLVHAQHIHFGAEAIHECPNFKADTNGDFRLNTAEGVPFYGPIAVSLTTRGDVSDGSGLAVERFPVADRRGHVTYKRADFRAPTQAILQGIKAGKGVVVVHGVDYNQNGKYDFESAGASELNPKLPAEATDPVACGLLR